MLKWFPECMIALLKTALLAVGLLIAMYVRSLRYRGENFLHIGTWGYVFLALMSACSFVYWTSEAIAETKKLREPIEEDAAPIQKAIGPEPTPDASRVKLAEARLQAQQSETHEHLLRRLNLTHSDWQELKEYLLALNEGGAVEAPSHLREHQVVLLAKAGKLSKAARVLAGGGGGAWIALMKS